MFTPSHASCFDCSQASLLVVGAVHMDRLKCYCLVEKKLI